MDSEDERMLEEEEMEIANGVLSEKPTIFLRPFEGLQWMTRRVYVLRVMEAKLKGTAVPQRDPNDIRGMLRIRRLSMAILGFYNGYLDLAGRSEKRFRSLTRRMDQFLADVAELREHTATRSPVMLCGGVSKSSFFFSPVSVFDDFKSKYKLGYVDLGEIFTIPVTMHALYASGSSPKFQTLLLEDLPPELLLHICGLAHLVDARALGHTCRAFRALLFSFEYKERRLALYADPTLLKKTLAEMTEADKHYLRCLKDKSRARLLAQFRFLLARPDILACVQCMQVCNLWTYTAGFAAGLVNESDQHNFAGPIWKHIEFTIAATTNLVEFHLDCFDITNEMIHAMASLRRLQTLSVCQCPVDQLPPWETLPVLPTVVNLVLCPQILPGHEMLGLVALVPNVVSLTIMGLPKVELCTLPTDDIRARYNPFRTMERANFSHIDDDSVSILFAWILEAAITPGQQLRLTHFRLELEFGLQQDEVFQLISVLQGAPLHTLAIEGLSYVGADLFARLAETFPGLTALTLFYQANVLQRGDRSCRWPGATWEYAAYLAAFPNLRHFVWNFEVLPLQWSVTYDLPFAEAGYPASPVTELCNIYHEDYNFEDHSGWAMDLARLFSVYCTKLETLGNCILEFTLVRTKTRALVPDLPRVNDNGVEHNPRHPKSTSFDNPWHVRRCPARAET